MNKREKWMNLIKNEFDVELFSAVHGMSTVFVFGFLLYVAGTDSVPFLVILEMFLLAYGISWFQRLIFSGSKLYSEGGRRFRSVVWSVGPVLMTQVCGIVFHWYRGQPGWVVVAFLVIMLIYYIMIWVFLQIFYRDETQRLNRMLEVMKGSCQEGRMLRRTEKDGGEIK